MTKPKLIVVDDEEALAGFVRDVAEQAGYLTELFHDAESFRNKYSDDAHVIVLDLLLPGEDGVELIRHLAQIGSDACLILISGFDPGVLHSAQKLAIEQGLNFIGSLGKPFRHHELLGLLDNLTMTPRHQAGTETIDYTVSAEELRHALRNDELVVHYQPKVDLRTGDVAGVEALVRWQHPRNGLLSPDRFVPFAEQFGLIDDLTWAVLKQVARQCRRWLDMGIDLTMAVNISANTLHELSLPEYLSGVLDEYDIKPHQIVLEVTESALMQELIKSLDILTRLRMKGFHLSIDDFGTGYSSLVQLYRAPFSELKIDRSFVTDMANDREACAIVETVILLGKKLGMRVVAEGIETRANLDTLVSMSCDFAQGYFIAMPQSGESITEWLASRSAQSGS